MSILNCVFDTPLGQTPDMKLIPRVIKEWQWSADKMALEVRLRDDVRFTTATSSPRTPSSSPSTATRRRRWRRAPPIAGQEVIAKVGHRGTFVLALPFATLPARLSIFGSAILPRACREGRMTPSGPAHRLGTVPAGEHSRESRIVLEPSTLLGGRAPIRTSPSRS